MITDSLERSVPTAGTDSTTLPMVSLTASTGLAKPPAGLPAGRAPPAGAAPGIRWVHQYQAPPAATATSRTAASPAPTDLRMVHVPPATISMGRVRQYDDAGPEGQSSMPHGGVIRT